MNITRPVLERGAPHRKLNETTAIWGCADQPWLDHGITMQCSATRYNRGQSVQIASEAIDTATGKVLASRSHPTCTHDEIRRIIADRALRQKAA